MGEQRLARRQEPHAARRALEERRSRARPPGADLPAERRLARKSRCAARPTWPSSATATKDWIWARLTVREGSDRWPPGQRADAIPKRYWTAAGAAPHLAAHGNSTLRARRARSGCAGGQGRGRDARCSSARASRRHHHGGDRCAGCARTPRVAAARPASSATRASRPRSAPAGTRSCATGSRGSDDRARARRHRQRRCHHGLDGFHGDTSATFFIGEPSPEARHVVDVARRCRDAGIAVVRDGARLGDIGAAIEELARAAKGCSVVREFGGHGIGRVMHAAPHVAHHGQRGDRDRACAPAWRSPSSR